MTQSEFEAVLDRATKTLAADLQKSAQFHDPEQFERRVLRVLELEVPRYNVEVGRSFHPHAFPDIVVGEFGIEVKYSKRDTWHALGNSILEQMRDFRATKIYVLFGKTGGKVEVTWRHYADCIEDIRVTNAPRFALNMDTSIDPLFQRMNTTYDAFSVLSEEDKMSQVRKYARDGIDRGERPWWLEPSHALPIRMRLYMSLTSVEKRKYRAEAAILFPGVCSDSRVKGGKYADAALYLLMHRGVFCPQARDLYSAGSVVPDSDQTAQGNYVLRSLRGIDKEMRDAASNLDDNLFVSYWGQSCLPARRIDEWLKRADACAKGWKPSDWLFTNRVDSSSMTG